MKNNFVIITENTSDLSLEYIERNNIVILPITYTIGDETYDGTYQNAIAPDVFYSKVKKHSIKTDECTLEQTIECYKKIIEDGYSFLHVACSSSLATCYEQGVKALEMLEEEGIEFRGYCIDSKCASLGQGLLVDVAVNLRNRGLSLKKICDELEVKKYNLCHYFTVDSLEYLFKGGRFHKTSSLMGSIFAIKPILCMNDDGKIVKIDRVNGRKKSLDELITKLAFKLSNDVECPFIYIAHADCLKDAEYIKEEIFKKYKLQTKVINNIGPIIGAHTGPGAVALFFFGSDRKEEILVRNKKIMED